MRAFLLLSLVVVCVRCPATHSSQAGAFTQQAVREGPPLPLSTDGVSATSTPKPTSVHRVQSRQEAEVKASGPHRSPTKHSTGHSTSVQPPQNDKEGGREAGYATDTVEGRNDDHDTQRQSREDYVENIQATPLKQYREAEQPRRHEENASVIATSSLLDYLGEGEDPATSVFPGLAQRNQNQSKNHGQHRRKRGYFSAPCHCESGCSSPWRSEKGLVNMLLGKPVEGSSQDGSILPCVTTDGTQYGDTVKCWKSASTDNMPWLTIDLQTQTTITSVLLFHTITTDENKHQMRSIGVSLDGQLCGDVFEYGDKRPHVKTYMEERTTWVVLCETPLTGRYIHIYKREWADTYLKYMDFCAIRSIGCPKNEYQVEKQCLPCPAEVNCPYACDNYHGCHTFVKYNMAIKKTTSQSSTKWGNSAYAVDGLTRVSDSTRCTSTNPAVDGSRGGWWQVDMEALYVVYNVDVTSRLDCCAEDLPAEISVFVDNVGFSATTRPIAKCTTFARGPLRNGQKIQITCPAMVGQWVSLLSMDENKALAFCEVEVYGQKARHYEPGAVCKFENDISRCQRGLECHSDMCKVPLEGDCTGNLSPHCVPGAFCDIGLCKMPLLGSCKSTSTCRFGTVCDNSVCKWNVQETCQNTQECVTGTTCDSFNKCKILIGETCMESENCVAGAECTLPPGNSPISKKCICRNLNSANASACEPREGYAGGACTSSGTCITANAACTSNVCNCNSGYTPYSVDLTCRVKVKQTCASNDDCVSALCDIDNTCKWLTGLRCEPGECQTKDNCSNEFCRIRPGGACSVTKPLCMTGSTCVDTGSGTFCKVRTGQPCDSSDDQCNLATVCADITLNNQTTKLCALRPGQSCDGANSGLCEPNSVCKNGGCWLKLFSSCAGDLHAMCQAGTTCDNGLCKISLRYDCIEDDQCQSNTTCDEWQKKCYLPLDQGCEEHPDSCVTGTTCDESHVCSCTTSGAVDLDSCAPKAKYVGGACTVSGNPNTPDCNPGAFCNANGTCQCKQQFAVERTNFTCGQGPGSKCNATHWCVTGTTCDPNNICTLEVKQRCEGRNLGNCKVGTFCDNGVCRLSIGQNCHGVNRDACGTGSVCDVTSICKLSSGHHCGEDLVCLAGAKCTNNSCTCVKGISTQNGSLCVSDEGKVEGKCSGVCDDPNALCGDSGRCKCGTGYTVEASNLTCKLGAGSACKGRADECISGTFCDLVNHKCAINLGEHCSSSPQCQAGASCDIDRNCRMDFGGHCSRYDLCSFGLICDYKEKCSYGLGRACSKSEDCTIGAICTNGSCVCQNRLSKDSAICEPERGQVFSECSEVLACTVDDSSCVNDVCQCNDGFTVTQTFTCKGNSDSFQQSGSTKLALFGGMGFLACLIALAIGFVGYKRYKNKKSAMRDLRTNQAARMQDIQQLAAQVEMASRRGTLHLAATGTAPSGMNPANTAGEEAAVGSEAIPKLGDTSDSVGHKSLAGYTGFFNTINE